VVAGEYWKLHDDASIRQIGDAAMRLLAKSGCRIEHEGLLKLLGGAGCRVDNSAMRCYFPEKLVREVIEHVGGKTTDTVEIPVGWNPQHHIGLGGSFPHMLDWPSGERRLATRQDFVEMARMAHTLDEFTHIGKVLVCPDVDPRIEPLWATVQLAEITDKPFSSGEVFYAEYLEPLVRMGEVLSGKPGDTSLIAPCDFFISPLIYDRKQAECFIAKRGLGLPNVVGTMVISGMSGPVTLAGCVAISVAEVLAGCVFGYVVNPDVPAVGLVATGSMDMRTLSACFGSPEAILQDMAIMQVLRRLYGINAGSAVGYCDCKRPGLEATFQKMLPLAGIPLGLTTNLQPDGLLSAGQDYSPVQHMLDKEIHEAVGRFWGAFEINEETIAVKLTEKMIASGETNFLETEHTAAHFRSEQWYPRWFDRTQWQGTEFEKAAEENMLRRIDEYCKDAIRNYEQPDIDKAKITELKKIYRAAEKDILGR
jgi:trimethylamine--corrinoid protein Co-methyltransferase